MRLFNRKGQSTLEYAVLIAGVVGAVLIFAPYLQRVAQGRFKESSDRIGYRFGGETETSISDSVTAWEEKGTGSTETAEIHISDTNTIISATGIDETLTRSEGEEWGTTVPEFRDFPEPEE